ncbi:MAG TPA: PEP-CTERM sorting domain-containing protein [Terriglobia bacterium]
MMALSIAITSYAGTIAFRGSGTTGTLAPGESWAVGIDGGSDWGSPGVGVGVIPWNGTVDAIGFVIQFFGLPSGDVISTKYGTNCNGGSGGGTVFCNSPYSGPWKPDLLSPTSIAFLNGTDDPMTPGDDFFVNIFFTGGATVTHVTFAGGWYTSGTALPVVLEQPAPTPEPASVLLLTGGLLGLAGTLRRRLQSRK